MARRFRFRLETLLRVRQTREREARRNVAAKNAEIARMDQLNQQTADEIRTQQAALLELQQTAHLDPQVLQRGRAWVAHLRRTLAQRQMQRTELVAHLVELQGVLRAARIQTRVLEKLRARQVLQYRRVRDRQEQAAADELAQQMHGREVGL
jgi:flagellar protein FliJ